MLVARLGVALPSLDDERCLCRHLAHWAFAYGNAIRASLTVETKTVAGVILLYFFVLLLTRVWYESMIIRFQMAEDIREIRKKYLA